MGVRFYLTYSAAGPATASDLNSLSGSISTFHHTTLAPLFAANFTLTEIDILDISTLTGVGVTHSYSDPGIRTGNTCPDNCATNVEFLIGHRYRGGKPRFYLPPGVTTDMATVSTWNSSYITAVNTNVANVFSSIEALSLSSLGTLAHAYVSYYDGVATTTPPWRGPGFKYPPKYRSPNALTFPVLNYSCKAIIGSQRRRRSSTTP
jgi:hypothetical protein